MRATDLIRRSEGKGKACTAPSGVYRKAKAPQREIAPHHHGADGADQRAGQHVARIMRLHRHPACHDQQSIDPQDRAGTRPQCAKRHQHRKRGGGVSRRQAGIGGGPTERAEQIGINAAADARPRAAENMFDDVGEYSRQSDRKKHKADAHHHRGQHQVRNTRKLRQCREEQKQNPKRPQEPTRFAVAGDLVEEPRYPARQPQHRLRRCRVNEDQAHEKHRNGNCGRDREPLRRRHPCMQRMKARRTRQRRKRCDDVAGTTAQRRLSDERAVGVQFGLDGHRFSAERNKAKATACPLLIL